MNKMIENLLFYKTFLSKAKPRLPAEYQEVEWIKGTSATKNDNHIVTDINVDADTEFEACFMLNETANYDRILGATYDYTFYFVSTSGFGFAYGEYKDIIYSALNKKITAMFKDKKLLLNGEQVYEADEASITSSKLSFFAETVGGDRDSRMTLYYAKVWNDDIEYYFIPCYRKSDGEIGLYELATKTFYSNAGDGTFTKGADITSPYSYLTSTNTTRYPEVLNGLKVLTFDGSENWTAYVNDTCYTGKYASEINEVDRNSLYGFSPSFKHAVGETSFTISENEFVYIGNDPINGNMGFKHATTSSESADTWKAYLQQHPVKLLSTVNTPDSSIWRSVIRKKDKVTGYLNEATGEFIPVYEGIPYAGDGRVMMMRSPLGDGEDIDELDFDNELEPEYAEEQPFEEEEYTEEREVNDDEGLMQTEEGDEYNSEHPDEAD